MPLWGTNPMPNCLPCLERLSFPGRRQTRTANRWQVARQLTDTCIPNGLILRCGVTCAQRLELAARPFPVGLLFCDSRRSSYSIVTYRGPADAVLDYLTSRNASPTMTASETLRSCGQEPTPTCQQLLRVGITSPLTSICRAIPISAARAVALCSASVIVGRTRWERVANYSCPSIMCGGILNEYTDNAVTRSVPEVPDAIKEPHVGHTKSSELKPAGCTAMNPEPVELGDPDRTPSSRSDAESLIDVDIAIVGAGVAGTTAAIVAASTGNRVALLGPRAERQHAHFGHTVPPEAQPILNELGLRRELQTLRGVPSWANRSAWGSEYLRDWDHIYNPYGPAWQISANDLASALRREAISSGAHFIEGSLRTLRHDGASHHLQLAPSAKTIRSISARYIMDATGRRAAVARRLGGSRINYDHLVAAVGLLPAHGGAANTTTLVESTREGWWYSIHTTRGLVVSFMTDADILSRSHGSIRENWIARLEEAPHTHTRAQTAHANWTALSLTVASAATSMLDSVVGPGWIAIGDSAATYDPLSSHGILHSLSSAIRASGAVAAALSANCCALSDYHATECEEFHEHLRQRRSYYGTERRWRSSTFWARRGDRAGDSTLPALATQ